MFDDKTGPAIITREQIEQAERDYRDHAEGLLELDRFLGTVESYGAYNNHKPEYSNDDVAQYAEIINFIKRGA
jgi:hypothetical protein